MRFKPHDDSGAALVLALIFLMIISLGATALLSLASASVNAQQAIQGQGYQVYSATGGVDEAVSTMRIDPTQGVFGGSCGLGGVLNSRTLNGVATEVRCTAAAGSGSVTGTAVSSLNTPSSAVLSLAPRTAPAEVGIRSTGELGISGGVVSNSAVEAVGDGAGNKAFVIDGPLTARLSCDPAIVFVPAADGSSGCDKAGAPIANSDDPDYPMQFGHPSVATLAPSTSPAGCPASVSNGATYLVVFEPGAYRSAATLNVVFQRCAGSVFWFRPGFYYFDFTDGDSTPLHIVGATTRVVGGQPLNWAPPTTTAGDAAPAVPFPTGAYRSGGCRTSEEFPDAVGVQWVFGGTSRLSLDDAKVQLCATSSTTEQQISIYGVPPQRETTGTVGTAIVEYPAATFTGSGFTPLGNASAADAAAADLLSPSAGSSSATGVLNVAGFAPVAPLPAGATVTGVKLRVVQRAANNQVTALSATVTAGALPVKTINSVSNGCNSATTTALCAKPSASSYYDQQFDLGAAGIAGVNSLIVRIDASVQTTNNGGTRGLEQVDAVLLVVTYTAPNIGTAYRRLSGCATVVGAGGCALITTFGSGKTQLSLHGTVYAPTAYLDIKVNSVGNQVLKRGVIARSMDLQITGSTVANRVVELPKAGTGKANRKVVLTAYQDGLARLRAVVEFEDSASPGASTKILSWTVLR